MNEALRTLVRARPSVLDRVDRIRARLGDHARPAKVRDGVRLRWRTGTATFLDDDDATARHRLLGKGRPSYRLDGILLRRLARGGPMLTIRIDLD